jgi:hypothetical protein
MRAKIMFFRVFPECLAVTKCETIMLMLLARVQALERHATASASKRTFHLDLAHDDSCAGGLVALDDVFCRFTLNVAI